MVHLPLFIVFTYYHFPWCWFRWLGRRFSFIHSFILWGIKCCISSDFVCKTSWTTCKRSKVNNTISTPFFSSTIADNENNFSNESMHNAFQSALAFHKPQSHDNLLPPKHNFGKSLTASCRVTHALRFKSFLYILYGCFSYDTLKKATLYDVEFQYQAEIPQWLNNNKRY